MPLQIHYPFKPFFINQHWGNPNPAYDQFGFHRHNGTDASAAYADQFVVYNPLTWMVFCPVENFRVHQVRYMPQGGGNEIWLISKERVQIGGRLCFAYLVFAHAEKILVPVGHEPQVGELLMIADNTGFSTGPHTHIGLYRVQFDGKIIQWLDQNEANGSFNPELCFTEKYAVDVASLNALVISGMRYFKYLSGL